ncbi:MAG: hypothetical protein MJY85_00695 [Fibrobacter sp.]|nr:hypothetical protein [Fibrobacter sp.]
MIIAFGFLLDQPFFKDRHENLVGGTIVFLECENHPKLMSFLVRSYR